MKKLTKEEKHKQCVKEIRATLIVVGICFLWHVLTAFLLNSVDWTLFHMPAWFVVFCVRDSCDCNHRGILVAQIRVCRFFV